MTGRSMATVVVAALAALGGCRKESGGGAPGGSALDYPADTSALVGFVRKGPAPSAEKLRDAMKALLGEEPDGEIRQMIDACIAPVAAHTERTTIIVRGAVKDERVVAIASGPGLRPALEGCFKTMQEARGKSFAPAADGDFTLYPQGSGDPLIARWTGDDLIAISDKKENIESTVSAKGGLAGTPLEKVVAAVDRSSTLWFAAAGPGLPEQANIESASGTIQDLTGAVRVVFKTPEAAAQASAMVQSVIPKGVKVAGPELTIGVNVADLPSIMMSGKPGTPPKPPLAHDQARALLAAGPLVFAFLLVAGDSAEAAPPAPITADPSLPPEPPAVAPPAPPEPVPPEPAPPEPAPPATP